MVLHALSLNSAMNSATCIGQELRKPAHQARGPEPCDPWWTLETTRMRPISSSKCNLYNGHFRRFQGMAAAGRGVRIQTIRGGSWFSCIQQALGQEQWASSSLILLWWRAMDDYHATAAELLRLIRRKDLSIDRKVICTSPSTLRCRSRNQPLLLKAVILWGATSKEQKTRQSPGYSRERLWVQGETQMPLLLARRSTSIRRIWFRWIWQIVPGTPTRLLRRIRIRRRQISILRRGFEPMRFPRIGCQRITSQWI